MMAETLDISAGALRRREARQVAPPPLFSPDRSRVPFEVCKTIREEYLAHYRQWGPRTLAHWADREGLGHWSPTTIARILTDLQEPPEEKPAPVRYEVAAPMVMWSEDGAFFRDRGKKKELLVLQDVCSRYKVNHDLVPGPARGEDVCDYLEEAFEEHGAPLLIPSLS